MDTQNDIYSQAFDHMPFMCDPSRPGNSGVLGDKNEKDLHLSDPSKKSQIGPNRRTAVSRGGVRVLSRGRDPTEFFSPMGQNHSTESFEVSPTRAARSGGIRGEAVYQEGVIRKQTAYEYATNSVPSRYVSNEKVVMRDDYSQPLDRLSAQPENQLQTTNDYMEPYLSQSRNSDFAPRRSCAVKGRQINSVTKPEDSNLYELAKDIDEIDGAVQVSQKSPEHVSVIQDCSGQEYNHLDELNKQVLKTSLQEDVASYDHINTWQEKLLSKSSQISSSVEEKRQSVVSDDVFIPDMAHNKPNLFPGTYEDPWDSRERQEMLGKILEKAKTRYSSNTPESSCTSNNDPSCLPNLTKLPHMQTQAPGPPSGLEMEPPQISIYEDAWDTAENRRRLSEIIEKAEARFSRSGDVSPKPSTKTEPCFSQSSDPSPQPPPVPSHGRASQQTNQPADGSYETSWSTRQSQAKLEENHNRRTFAPQTSPSHRQNQQHLHVMAERIDSMIPLEKQKFYHGSVKRDYAEKLLLVHREGSYLIRLSETSRNAYSLSIKGHQGIPMHIKITCRADGSYILGENSPPFNTIPEMIDYYATNALPVKEAEKICLIHPISCRKLYPRTEEAI